MAVPLTDEEAAPALSTPNDRQPVNLRSVLLGLLGVIFICGLTAYNDYVVVNTYLVGNFLPIGLILFFLAFIMLINAPLSRWAPRWAFSTAEMGVAMCMVLVTCAIPSSGLMRYLPGHLVGIWDKAGQSIDHVATLKEANLPDWLFPRMTRTDIADRANDPVVREFMQRAYVSENGFMARVRAVPWGAWAMPAFAWGVLMACIYGGFICLSIVLRRQWVENERLPYPLASVYLSLIEQPRPGTFVNSLLRNRAFWIAFSIVFLIHGVNALRLYDPKVWPEIPLGYSFWGIFGNPPLSYADWSFKAARLFFCILGITYFLQTNVAFSIWFIYIITQVVAKGMLGNYSAELTDGMASDQTFGAMVPFTCMMLWVGRKHFAMVGRRMFGRAATDDPEGRYLPYVLSGWGTLVFSAGIVAWLCLAGVSLVSAVCIVLTCGMLYLVVARVVAETGLIFVQIPTSVQRPFVYMAQSLPQSLAHKVSTRSFFFATLFNGILVHDQRESISGFAPQALRVADGAAYENERNWRRAVPFTVCLFAALVVGYCVAGGAMLYTEYNYSASADRLQTVPINGYGVSTAPGWVLDAVRDYRATGGPTDAHSRWFHLGLGGVVTTVLSLLRLRFVGWPLHPIGFMLTYSYATKMIWFSVFVGWIAKVLIVRFGGASLYRAAKPLFMGMIIGEAGAAAFWLIVSLVRSSMGLTYHAVGLLPG